jgi:hypothetical protein
MSIHYSATGAAEYTITREIAGGAFTPRAYGVAIRPAGKLRAARAACVRHNGGQLEWTDVAQARALSQCDYCITDRVHDYAHPHVVRAANEVAIRAARA